MAKSGPSFEIHPDIRVAQTLPARVYSDPGMFALQRERVFARTWHYAGHDDLVKVAGQVYPFSLLPGTLDELLLLTRDADDRLHCLSNVCTHRGTLVVEGAGHEQQLRCRYHGRRFTLDGRFHSMPEFDGAANFPSRADDLPHVALDAWERFLLVALDPLTTCDEVIGPMRTRLAGLPYGQLSFDATGAREFLVNANWALYVDNYLEGFHIPYVHQSLAGTLDYAAYAVELDRYSVLQLGIAKEGETAFGRVSAHPDAERAIAAYYYWLFPTTMFNVYPWASRSTSSRHSPSIERACRSSRSSGMRRCATAERARVSTASSARTRRSSNPCSAASGRASTTAAATRPRARPESITSTVSWPSSCGPDRAHARRGALLMCLS